MSGVQKHYDEHLGPVYAWMHGGVDRAIELGAAEIDRLGIGRSVSGLALDLGAGFGTHAIPLARRGFEVLAIDSCAALLDELKVQGQGLAIETLLGDLHTFRLHLSRTPELILCMGDTLTHLENKAAVISLIEGASGTLGTGGRLVTTFRDYSTALTGEQRFIPVRSDERRILTCFLEYTDSHVVVHDVLHEWHDAAWRMMVSAYPKLRLSPAWVIETMEKNGFSVEHTEGRFGLVCLVARLP